MNKTSLKNKTKLLSKIKKNIKNNTSFNIKTNSFLPNVMINYMSFKFKPTYHVSKYCTKVKTFHLSFLGELSFRIVAAYQKIIVITIN
jgi:hypothetical protein